MEMWDLHPNEIAEHVRAAGGSPPTRDGPADLGLVDVAFGKGASRTA
jgi:hypothetical protein